ncbi:hypothetical protein VC83_01210 [Pseudogymnoascus destructans]|nr:uncharacterized protein VC83_01210 [Pseudogymnoascus destructans]OAF62704.2 hypothetical protein VC83_01210 [Pseudogymnoascus destructans]
MVRLLLEKNGIDANSKDNNSRTALSWAAQGGNEEVLGLLLREEGIDVNSKDNNGWTALSWAVKRGREGVVRLLLEKKGIDANSKDNNGRTALSWAAEKGNKEVVGQLLDKEGIDANSKDNNGQTALLWAIEKGHITMVNLFTKRDSTTLNIAIQCKNHRVIELLLNGLVYTKDIMAVSWRHAYGRQPSDILLLTEGEGQRKSLRCIAERGIRHELAQWSAETGIRRSLFLVLDLSSWQNDLFPGLEKVLTLKHGQLRYFQEPINGIGTCFCVAVCFPPRHGADQKHGNMPAWNKRAIAWTMIPPKDPSDGPSKMINHLSTLPYGWIPDDGVDFFKQFIICLKDRWVVGCDLVEGDLAKRRGDQLRQKGESPELIRNLAKDAQTLAGHHNFLQDQVATAKEFAKESGGYREDNALKDLQNVIDGFAYDVNNRIKQLDQTIRDLLQFEFAWVSINEAHRSTNIATSMKRLSWITFIFLPALFASVRLRNIF